MGGPGPQLDDYDRHPTECCRDCNQSVTGSVHVELISGRKMCFRCFKRMEDTSAVVGRAQTDVEVDDEHKSRWGWLTNRSKGKD